MNRQAVDSSLGLDKEYLQQQGFVYGWVMELDRVQLCRIEHMSWDPELVQEARFFAIGKELHIFGEEERSAVVTQCTDETESFTEAQLLQPRYGELLQLRHYIAYDTDGQAFIQATCLDDLVKGDR